MWITLTHARQAGWLFNSLRSHVSQVLTGKFPNYSLHFSATLVASCGHVICAGFSEDVMLVSSEPRLLERECFAWMLSLWFHWPLAGQCVEYCFPASIIISFDYLAKPLGRVICFVCVSTLCVCVCAWLCLTLCIPWTAACQASLSMGFTRQNNEVSCCVSYSMGSSQPRGVNCAPCIFCIGRQILYNWAPWERLPYSNTNDLRLLRGTI